MARSRTAPQATSGLRAAPRRRCWRRWRSRSRSARRARRPPRLGDEVGQLVGAAATSSSSNTPSARRRKKRGMPPSSTLPRGERARSPARSCGRASTGRSHRRRSVQQQERRRRPPAGSKRWMKESCVAVIIADLDGCRGTPVQEERSSSEITEGTRTAVFGQATFWSPPR